jgi:hypothetical protein
MSLTLAPYNDAMRIGQGYVPIKSLSELLLT